MTLPYLLVFIFTICCFTGVSQNLTGTWEGQMSAENLQINITQESNTEICGYTYDHFRSNPLDYCKAYFRGYYNKRQEAWELNGISFLENSGTHVLMRIKLYKDKIDGEEVLLALVQAKSSVDFFMSLGIRENVVLRRVSLKPTKLARNLPPCFPDPERPPKEKPVVKPRTDTIVKKIELIKKPVDTVAVKKKDTVITKPDIPIVKEVPKKIPDPIVETVKERKNVTFSTIPVTVKTINMKLYDNAIVDGDTVSIFYNGKLLVDRKRLSEQPIEINLNLDEKAARHEILLFAHNLGSIPPNTALIVVTIGGKRYELHAKASLKENAILIFEYDPK